MIKFGSIIQLGRVSDPVKKIEIVAFYLSWNLCRKGHGLDTVIRFFFFLNGESAKNAG